MHVHLILHFSNSLLRTTDYAFSLSIQSLFAENKEKLITGAITALLAMEGTCTRRSSSIKTAAVVAMENTLQVKKPIYLNV